MHAVEIQQRLAFVEAERERVLRKRHALCRDLAIFVARYCRPPRRLPTPIRKVRFSDATWDLVLQACDIDKTMARVVLVGAIVEALLVLRDSGHDLDPILSEFCKSPCRFLQDRSGSPIGDVLARMEVYGYTPKRPDSGKRVEPCRRRS